MGKQVKMNGHQPDVFHPEQLKEDKEWCINHYGMNLYVQMIRHFIVVIEGLKEDARKHNEGKRATTQQVLDFVMCETMDELIEACELKEGESPEFTLKEWNSLYRAAAYETYLKNSVKQMGKVGGKKKRRKN